MKLYADPISTTCRPVLLMAAETGADLELHFVDLFNGAHMKPEFAAINPNCAVPTLADDDFVLTESSAILKYIADKTGSPSYPPDPKKRAKINALMDWFNTGLYRDFGYGFVYPQIFPNFKNDNEVVQKAIIDKARERSKKWFNILDKDIIGPKNKFLTGDQPTIADFFGAGIMSIADIVRCDFSSWPNIQRWLKNMRALKSWDKVHADYNKKLVEPTKGVPFAMF
jgi:glutathione S-transferase